MLSTLKNISRKMSTFTHGTIYLGADHAGLEMKDAIKQYLESQGKAVHDCGTYTPDRVDYPDYAARVAMKVLEPHTPEALGILVCGSGIGISIAANKLPGIRCGLCHDYYTGMMTRKHNNANILALGGRVIGLDVAKNIVDVFLSTPFEGGHHEARVAKIHALEVPL
jgi:ribose 5-phosphate isomerase B